MLDRIISVIFITQWHTLFCVGVLLLLAAEIGYRGGQRLDEGRRRQRHGQSGTLQGALLGMLGLLLGFTFAMAVSRYDTRKALVMEEANAIGAAWLRAGFLPEPTRVEARELLMDYIATRLKLAREVDDPQAVAHDLARSEHDQAELWRQAVALSQEKVTPLVALYASSLNEIIELDTKRQVALTNHVPSSVWLLLLLVSVTVCWATGYTTGLSESGRLAVSMIILPCLITVVISIVGALDHPHTGLISVSQQSMEELQLTLRKYNPTGTQP